MVFIFDVCKYDILFLTAGTIMIFFLLCLFLSPGILDMSETEEVDVKNPD